MEKAMRTENGQTLIKIIQFKGKKMLLINEKEISNIENLEVNLLKNDVKVSFTIPSDYILFEAACSEEQK